jgi:hypothetical protein
MSFLELLYVVVSEKPMNFKNLDSANQRQFFELF